MDFWLSGMMAVHLSAKRCKDKSVTPRGIRKNSKSKNFKVQMTCFREEFYLCILCWNSRLQHQPSFLRHLLELFLNFLGDVYLHLPLGFCGLSYNWARVSLPSLGGNLNPRA